MLQEYHIFEKLAEYKKQGKIRHIGFSFHDSPEVLEKICSAYPWEFAQIQLNYVDWDFQDAKAQYEILERHGLPAIIMEPVRGGALADLGEVIMPALTHPVTAMTEPTDRSMPPKRMTKVMPHARYRLMVI